MEFQSDFVGRDKELEELIGHLDQAKEGKGKLVFITGEAGIGKTRLVQELIKKTEDMGVQALSGRCLYQDGSDPYLPFIETLKKYLSGSDEEEEVQYRIPMGLSAMNLDEEGDSDSFRENIPMGLIGIGSDSEHEEEERAAHKSITDIDFTKERDRMFSTVSYLIQDLSMDKPLMFFLDDLHWADTATLQLLTYIARNIKDVKVLMVCAFRSEELEMGGRRHPLKEAIQIMRREHLFSEVKLTRIGQAETSKIISSLLKDSPLPRGFTETVFKETEGNPYFIEEVIKSLVSERVLDINDPDWFRRFDLSKVRIPATVNDLVLGKLENLEPGTKKTLEMASVIGDVFTLDILAGVTKTTEEEMVDHLDDLVESKMIREEAGGLVEKYSFTHKLIREVLYTKLSRAKRRLLHKKVGEAIEKMPEKTVDKEVYSLAFHFSQGNQIQKAVRYTILAGDKASSTFAAEDAIHFYNRTIEFLEKMTPTKENDGRRIAILTKIGDLHYMVGEWDRAVDYYYLMERWAKKTENMKMVGLANRKTGQIERLRGNWDTAAHHYEISLGIATKYGDDIGRADSERGLGYIHWRTGEFDEAIKHFEDSLEISKGIGDRFITGRTYIELGNVLSERGILEGAEFHYNTAIEILEQIKDYMELARAYNNLGDVYMKKEDWDKAVEHLGKAIELSKKLGDPHMLSWALFNSAECYSKSGRLEQACDALEMSKDILQDSDDALGQTYLHIEYGIYYRFKKDWDNAIKEFETGLTMVEDLKVISVAAYGYIEIANMYIDMGNNASALEYLEKAKVIYEKLNAPIFVEKVNETIRSLK